MFKDWRNEEMAMVLGRITGVRKVLHGNLAELMPEKDCSFIPKPIGTFSCTGFLPPNTKPGRPALGQGAERGGGDAKWGGRGVKKALKRPEGLECGEPRVPSALFFFLHALFRGLALPGDWKRLQKSRRPRRAGSGLRLRCSSRARGAGAVGRGGAGSSSRSRQTRPACSGA